MSEEQYWKNRNAEIEKSEQQLRDLMKNVVAKMEKSIVKTQRGNITDLAWNKIMESEELKRARKVLSIHEFRVLINLVLDASEETK